MVRALHAAGIEVILDVVYNHTARGQPPGPDAVASRGIDNATYYRLMPDDPRYYCDVTGCGNTLDTSHPRTLQLVMDSLRYWVEEMHVDGFRFDLAVDARARARRLRRSASASSTAVHAGPGAGAGEAHRRALGRRPGRLPGRRLPGALVGVERQVPRRRAPLLEGRRRTWPARSRHRLSGSADLYEAAGRQPCASVNFITAHDGFTLHDLVTYNDKHNEANGEDNRDGADDNQLWNRGVEGETDDAGDQRAARAPEANLLATLLSRRARRCSLAGDEIGRTQSGNNNAYCQDNEICWLDWKLDDARRSFLAFVRRMIQLRQDQPVLQRRRFFRGGQPWDTSLKDLAWFRPDGSEMTEEDWQKPFAKSVAFLLGGDQIATPDERGDGSSATPCSCCSTPRTSGSPTSSQT